MELLKLHNQVVPSIEDSCIYCRFCMAIIALQAAMKSQMDNTLNLTAKRAYNAEVNQLSVADAAIAPPLSTVERTLQRHKVKTRPPLPATRQDLALPARYTTTNNGRPFKLIDDGQADRIIVFGTSEQLNRQEAEINCKIVLTLCRSCELLPLLVLMLLFTA